MLEKNFTVQGATPHLHADHAQRETLRSLMGPAPCWPDGTPRWKTPPCRAHGLAADDEIVEMTSREAALGPEENGND